MRTLATALLLVVLVGCGSTETPVKPPDGNPPPMPSINEVSVDDLPAVGDPVTPTDEENRIGVSAPDGWEASKRSDYLFFCRIKTSEYPSLYITAQDNPGIDETTADNFQAFASEVAIELQQSNRNLSGEVEAVQIGDFYGVEYHVPGKSRNERLTRVYLVTVHGGRRYTIEMRTREGTTRDFQKYAYAVAHSLDFAPPNEPEGPIGPAIVPPGNADGQ